MLVVKKFVFNLFSENTFVLWDEETKECAVIDPGCSDSCEEEMLSDYIAKNGLNVIHLISTHGHIDHILGCGYVKEKYNAEYYAPEKDIELIKRAEAQAAAFGISINEPSLPDHFIDDNLKLKIGSSSMTFLYTPGHTPGEYCLYLAKEAICFTGDVLFKNSIGRTDLWGGDYDTLLDSIKERLFNLPDNVIIYPGHGESSKIGIEKSENPFVHEISGG